MEPFVAVKLILICLILFVILPNLCRHSS